jgi:hypothetical protein
MSSLIGLLLQYVHHCDMQDCCEGATVAIVLAGRHQFEAAF